MFQEKDSLEIALNSLFNGVNTDIVSKFASPKNIIGKKEGDIIYQKGDATDYMYLLIEGIVKLKFTEPDGTNIYFNKEKDTFFGETELLEKTPRISSAVADTDCRMYTLNVSELKSLCNADSLIYKNLFNNHTINISEEEFSDNLKNTLNIEPNFNKLAETTEKFSFDYEEDRLVDDIPAEEKDQNISFDNLVTKEITDDNDFTEGEEVESSGEVNLNELTPEDAKNDEEKISFDNLVADDTDEDEIEEKEETKIPPVKDESEGFVIKDLPEVEDNSGEIPFMREELSSDLDDINAEKNNIEKTLEEKTPVPSFEPQMNHEEDDDKPAKRNSDYYKEILKAIRTIYSKTTLDEVLNSISESCSELLKTAGGVLYMVENETEELASSVLSGNSINEVRIKFSDGLQGIAAKEKRVIIVDNPHQDKNFNPVIEDLTGIKMRNILYYPILTQSREPVAVLELFNTERGVFLSPDVEMLDVICPFILQAIDNVRINEIIIQRKRMGSIGQITNFLNDDIRLPLLNIKHYSTILKKKISKKEINQVLDLQIEQADAVEEFLKSVSAFSNSQNIIEPSNVKLSEALNNTLALLAEYVESRNTIIYKKFDADALVSLDQKQFFQACYQIAQNACDAMPEDGKIYISTEKDGDFIKIKIRDTGKGIPENVRGNIFNPFYSKGKNNQAGIGLSIAEKIISDHGGYLMVDSNVGEGTTFIISLPIIF